MTDQVTENLGQFFEYIWGDEPGQVYLASLHKGGDFTQYLIDWPRQKDGIVRHVLTQSAEGKDVYYCPSLFVPAEDAVERNDRTGKPLATRANIKGSQVHWVDFDNGAAPKDWKAFAEEKKIPEPSLVIQSSVEGNEHAYWRIDGYAPVDAVEGANRSLALIAGADRSGWDGNQLLRPPYTANYGYRAGGEHKGWYRGSPQPVRILGSANPERINGSAFGSLANVERELLDNLQLSGTIPGIAEVLAYGKWNEALFKQFSMNKDEATLASPNKRSGSLQALAYYAAEAGFTDEQIYAVVDDADRRWEKYISRSPSSREKILKDTIVRARAKIGYLTGEDLSFAGLLGTGTQVTEVPKIAYSLEDFLNTEVHVEWLIKDLLAVEGIGLITGMPGVGKTQFGIQLGINLALGRPNILGWANEGGAKKVGFLSLEMGHAHLKHFMSKMANEYPNEIREASKNLTIVPLGASLDITKNEGQAFLKNLLAEYRFDVLFIDSLQRVTSKPLTDEVASKELMDVLASMRKQHNMGMYLIHHNRKKSQEKETGIGDLSELYGSQYLAANIDFVQAMRKTATPGELFVDTWKNRLAMERPTFRVKRNENLQFSIMSGAEDGDEGYRIERVVGRARGENPDSDEGRKGLDI